MGESALSHSFEYLHLNIIHYSKCSLFISTNLCNKCLKAIAVCCFWFGKLQSSIEATRLEAISYYTSIYLISPQLNAILSVFRGLSCGNFSVEWNKIIENCCSTFHGGKFEVKPLRLGGICAIPSSWNWYPEHVPNIHFHLIFIPYSTLNTATAQKQ